MKKLLFVSLFALTASMAQSAHSVTLTWTDSSNPVGTTYNVYRATGLCSGTPVFSKLASGITVKTYLDSTVIPGNYCYSATATLSGMESAQSVSVAAVILPDPPTGLTSVVK